MPPVQPRRHDAKTIDTGQVPEELEYYNLDDAVERCGPYGKFQWFVLVSPYAACVCWGDYIMLHTLIPLSS